MSAKKDLTGKSFGRLTVLNEVEAHIQPSGQKKIRWLCKCNCGKTKEILGSDLTSGKTTSCGCYRKKLNTKHSLSSHPLYDTWQGAISRCYNPNHDAYKNYGAKGIKMYILWRKSPVGFIHYVETYLGAKPSPKHTIDRIDNNGNYEPFNLRWATKQVQAINQETPSNNTSSVKGVSYNKKAKKWLAELHLKGVYKLHKYFKTFEEAVEARQKAEKIYHQPLLKLKK